MIHFNKDESVVFKEIPNNPLIKTKEDKKFYLELIELVNNNHCHYSAMINVKNRIALKDWILDKTPKLVKVKDYVHSISTHVIWILEGREDFPYCLNLNCKKQFGFHTKLSISPIHGNIGYRLYCCDKCRDSSPIVKEHRRKTNQLHLGVDNPFQCESVKQQCKQKHLENYGVEYASQSPIVRAKIRATVDKNKAKDPEYNRKVTMKSKATKLKKHGDPNYNNIEQIKATNLRIRGVEFPTQDPAVLSVRHQNNLLKYGVEEYLQLPEPHICSLSAVIEKYGVKSTLQLPEVKVKAISSMIENYGVSCAFYISGMQQQNKLRSLEKYGYEFPSQHPAIKNKIIQTRIKNIGTAAPISKRYIYKDISFDSTTELEFWIYCEDHGISIEKSTKMYEYEVNNQKHIYNVDFIVDGKEVEIKGNQFFKKDGTMYCPYKKKYWTNEQYDEECRKYEAKRQCMIKNNVMILKSSDLRYCKHYVENKYGKNYIKQFRKVTRVKNIQ